tara:strand:+ start:86 stop:367 length:282 start_codon:yes stop_codon:yes gene_type:complete
MGEAPPEYLYKEAINKQVLHKQVLTAASDDSLGELLEKTGLWRASSIDVDYKQHCSTGFSTLHQALPGAGWPVDGVTEFPHKGEGIGATQTPC